MNEYQVKDLLLEKGVKPNHSGFEYLASAVVKYEPKKAICKELYVEVAKEYGTTPTRVERAIRHAIDIADGLTGTNSEVIAGLNYQIKRKEA